MRALYNEAQTSHPTICCTEVKGGCCIGLIVAYCLSGKRRAASLNETWVKRVIVVYKKGFSICFKGVEWHPLCGASTPTPRHVRQHEPVPHKRPAPRRFEPANCAHFV